METLAVAWLVTALAHGVLAHLLALLAEPALRGRPATRALAWRVATFIPPLSSAVAVLLPDPTSTGLLQAPAPGPALATTMMVMVAVGTLVMLSRSLPALGGLHDAWDRSTAISSPADTAWARHLASCEGYRGLVVVVTHPSVAIPMASVDGTIILPTWFDGALTTAERRAVIAHELGHLVRRDPLMTALASWIRVVLWMQPLGMLARRRLHDAVEECADAFALRVTGCGLDLARALLKTSQRQVDPLPESVAPLVRRDGALVGRVVAMLGPHRPPAHAVGRPLSIGLAAAAVCFLIGSITPAQRHSIRGAAVPALSGFGQVTAVPAVWTPDDGTPAAPRSGRYP